MTDGTPRTQRHSRRRFLQVAGGATGFLVTASGRGDYAVAQTPVALDSYSQSPSFEGQDLPPVAERVSATPRVVDPVEAVGEYGGLWRTALIGGQDTAWLTRTVAYDFLVSWSPDWQEVVPNVAQAFESSEDGRSFTFHLREGMKWSDGEPFTSADIEFYVNSVRYNKDLNATEPDNPFSIEVADDITFTITYERPNGFALQNMCTADGAEWVRYPRHYLEQFHKDFNTENLEQLVEEAGVADWLELFRLKGSGIPGTPYDARYSNPDLPRVNAWQLVEPYGEGTRVSFTRNPYYWKVDSNGQQLPYIDEVRFDVLEDPQVLLLRISSGEIDFHARHVNDVTNKPVLAENRERGAYEFFDQIPASMNSNAVALNLTHKDEAKREIFQNLDFRAGLSHAIDRQQIIDVVYVSQGEPWQLAPREQTPWYNEALAKQYTEYDVDKANELLDKVLPDKDGDGVRLMPSGEPLSIVVEVTSTQPLRVDSMNLMIENWKAVGINASLKPEDRSLLYTRKGANEHDCVIWGGDGGLQDAILEPRWYFPSNNESNFAIAWVIWYGQIANPQAEPMEPPPEAQKQMDLYDEVEATVDPAVQNELYNELLGISQEMFYAIGIGLTPPSYGIKKINMRNVIDPMPSAWLYPNPGPSMPEQYFYEGGAPAEGQG